MDRGAEYVQSLWICGSECPCLVDMGPLYSFFVEWESGIADGDGRAAMRCVWRPFLFRVGLGEESVGEGGVLRQICVFGALVLQGRRSMR